MKGEEEHEVIGEMEESPCEDRRGLEKTVDTQFQ